MSKPVLGLILGGVLGVLDGLSSLVTAADDPAVRADIGIIVAMGVFKGMVSGVAIGVLTRRLRSLTVGVVLGLLIGAGLAVPVAILVGKYPLHIVVPGALLGVIVGFATHRYGSPSPARTAGRSA
jgi:hypothetical protein